MRVNIYAEEMTDRVEIVTKQTADGEFTGVRFYLELPVTQTPGMRPPPRPSVTGSKPSKYITKKILARQHGPFDLPTPESKTDATQT